MIILIQIIVSSWLVQDLANDLASVLGLLQHAVFFYQQDAIFLPLSKRIAMARFKDPER
jgi:hypothetical protein